MANLADLMIKLGVDSSGVGEGMDKANKALKVGAVAIAGSAVAAGKALFSIGSTFDDVSDTIQAGTGASGAQLDALVQSAKNVGAAVPDSFADIGQSIADVNQRLGLTGPTLEHVSEQFLELGRITGQAVDVSSLSGAFNAFKIKGDAIGTTMDQLYNVSKATGVSVNDLGTGLEKNAAVLTQFGFTAGQGAALLGTMNKAGISGDRVVSSLSKAMVGFAKDGKAPAAGLQDTISSVQQLLAAGKGAEATTLAAKVFGSRGAAPFIAAIKAGSLSMDGLNKVIEGNGQTILGTASETSDFAEAWVLFKNRAMLQLEPVATRFFVLLTTGMNWISNNGIPIILAVASAIERWKTPLEVVGAILATVMIPRLIQMGVESTIAGAKAVAAFIASQAAAIASSAAWLLAAAPFILLGVAIAGVIYVVWRFRDQIIGAARTAISWVQSHWPLLLAILGGPFGLAVAVIAKHWDKVIAAVKAVPGRIKDVFAKLPGELVGIGANVVEGLINGIKSKASDLAGTVAGMAKDAVMSPFKKALGIFSPSKVFYAYGENTADGYINAIQKKSPAVASAMQSVVQTATTALDNAKQLKQQLRDTFSLDFSVPGADATADFISGLNAQVKAAQDFVAKMADLKRLGLKQSVLDMFAAQGPAALAQLNQINAGNVGQVNHDIAAMNATGLNFANAQTLSQTGIDLAGKNQPVVVKFDLSSGDKDLQNLIKKWVRVEGGGDVQAAFGKK